MDACKAYLPLTGNMVSCSDQGAATGLVCAVIPSRDGGGTIVGYAAAYCWGYSGARAGTVYQGANASYPGAASAACTQCQCCGSPPSVVAQWN
jgi:hypothetical protein